METEISETALDTQFARFICRFDGNALTERAVQRLSRAVREHHVCLDLVAAGAGEEEWPDLDTWRESLRSCRAVGLPEALTPLVLTKNGRLYLRRYWDYEQALAAALRSRASRNPTRKRQGADATQEEAIAAAAQNQLTIISGGPGTGKTTTVLQILMQLVQASARPLDIALTAPTGKAAARLQGSLLESATRVKCPPAVLKQLPKGASTVHRLLGWKANSVGFRHDQNNPLSLDVLVVDEASMVSLPLMAKLLAALPEKTRVILLGDRDQLASVEAGAVLADMADAAEKPKSPLHDAFFVLQKNFRFGNQNKIHLVSQAVRDGEAEKVIGLIAEPSPEFEAEMVSRAEDLAAKLQKIVPAAFQDFLSEPDPTKALEKFDSFRILSALRQGPYGVGALNQLVEGILHTAGLIGAPTREYAGKPILVTRNDYQAKLFNGDIGLFLPDPADPQPKEKRKLWAWFLGEDGQARKVAPARLPDHETAYAMTVHKAQGSEFASVLFILPNQESPVLTRELVYTGLTRASKKVTLWYEIKVLCAAIGQQAARVSGLQAALS